MRVDPRSVVVGYAIATLQMSGELADLTSRKEAESADLRARIEAEWAALRNELAAARAELRAARAELENFKMLRAADEATKPELVKRRIVDQGRRAQRDAE